MTAELLPCPFCGSASVQFAHATVVYVRCDNCGAFGPTEGRDDGKATGWNDRAILIDGAASQPSAIPSRACVPSSAVALIPKKNYRSSDSLS